MSQEIIKKSYLIYQMKQDKAIKKILRDFQALKEQNGKLWQEVRNKEKYNKKLCSENRKRRLLNNELKREREIIIEQQMKRGDVDELKKLINDMRATIEDKDKQINNWQDEAVVLRTEITKQKQKSEDLQQQFKELQKRYQQKCKEYEVLFKSSYQSSIKQRITTPNSDYDEQIMGLINQNCELQNKIREMKETVKGYHQKIFKSQKQISDLLVQLQQKDEIINMVLYEGKQKQKEEETETGHQCSKEILKNQELDFQVKKIDLQTKGKEKLGECLALAVEQYCKDYENLLYSNQRIENLSNDGVTLNYCRPIRLQKQGKWYSQIRIVSSGEIYFGFADARFHYSEVMRPIRNFMYYNNCSGLVVINKEGKLVEKFAHEGDRLRLQVQIKAESRKIRFLKNGSEIYSDNVPECFKKAKELIPFVKLFKNMTVDLFQI